ncbi:helix-turn-helix transcriptional regulator [Lentilactobacillus senioris]|uniref:helix-turn-helix domain-containing protein n=1 Tax=Lentilactobacillus senioris TaxID=931534 RepID=UPI0022828220|nr:helix-turn-helix transcriptional regulator [Lentilactobacillus senioris]MCY9807287.1 helix-turn-helix transcriptional regulator [Lentilactobacillus senioris]
MKVSGAAIRNRRLKLGLSQRELAIDICTQATISTIENSCECKNSETLTKICNKIGLLPEEITNKYIYGERILKITEIHLCNDRLDLAEKNWQKIKCQRLDNSKNIDRYNLCKAIIGLISKNDTDEALFIFNEIIRRNNFSNNEHYIAWCFVGIGRSYMQKGYLERANQFYKIALTKINATALQKRMDLERVIDIYNVIVKSAILSHSYELAAQASQMAVKLLWKKQSLYRLTQLLEFNCQANCLLKRPKRASKMALLAYWHRQFNDAAANINEQIPKVYLPTVDELVMDIMDQINVDEEVKNK